MVSAIAAEDSAPKVPRDAIGAATPEYQQELLDKLAPAGDVGQPPAGVDPVIWEAFVPDDNAATAERVALGRKLYFDKRLSADGTVSCATCHDVTRGFTRPAARLGGHWQAVRQTELRRRC